MFEEAYFGLLSIRQHTIVLVLSKTEEETNSSC